MFNNQKKIQKLESDLEFWKKNCKEIQEKINTLKEENKTLKDTNDKLSNQIINFEKISKENQIMKKYYKLDKEPSSEVQAKVLADLRLHDMEFNILQEKLNYYQQQLNFFKNIGFTNLCHYPYYHHYY